MRKTIFPDKEEYKSTLGNGYYQTPYGDIRSFNDGDWFHYSLNERGLLIGEIWWGGEHYYNIRL